MAENERPGGERRCLVLVTRFGWEMACGHPAPCPLHPCAPATAPLPVADSGDPERAEDAVEESWWVAPEACWEGDCEDNAWPCEHVRTMTKTDAEAEGVDPLPAPAVPVAEQEGRAAHTLSIDIEGGGWVGWKLNHHHTEGWSGSNEDGTPIPEDGSCWVADHFDIYQADLLDGDWPENITFPAPVRIKWEDDHPVVLYDADAAPAPSPDVERAERAALKWVRLGHWWYDGPQLHVAVLVGDEWVGAYADEAPDSSDLDAALGLDLDAPGSDHCDQWPEGVYALIGTTLHPAPASPVPEVQPDPGEEVER